MSKDNIRLEHYGLEDDMVTYKQCLYIFDNNSLKLKVTYQCYDTKVAVHFDRDKTLELMKYVYY